jgi:hypothetical protein
MLVIQNHMPERFSASEEPLKQHELAGFGYNVDFSTGRITFTDTIHIGGMTDGGDDFRDFIVNTEDVGVRTDSTLTLPKDTMMEASNEEIHFTLPRTKQRGRIFRKGAAIYAKPVTQ